MAIQLSGSLAITGSLTTSTTIGAQGAINVTNATNPVSFTSTASLYSDGGVRFTKDMYVSGTAYFNNVTVFGTQSIAYISSSQLNIGTNLITVNTDTPTIRFGGLAVYDSGSTGLTGSLLWDSENNHWVYTNPSGSTYSGGMFMSGPRASALGAEQGTTACALMMGQGGDHITSSGIFHYGNATCFYGNASITSTGVGCFSGTVCAPNITSTGTICSSGNTCFGGMSIVNNCLGVGIATPTSKLEIFNGTAASEVRNWITSASEYSNYILDTDSSINYRAQFVSFGTTAAGTLLGINRASGSFLAKSGGPLGIGTRDPQPIVFGTNEVERGRITGTGIACFACQVCAPYLYINGTAENIASDTACGDLIQLYGGNITGTDCGIGIGFTRQGSQLGFIKTARENAVNEASYMIFATQTSAGSHPERMRINSGGDLELKGRSTTTNYQAVFYNDNAQLAINATNTSAGKSINFNPSSTFNALSIASTGVACFACGICTPCVTILANDSSIVRSTNTGYLQIAGGMGAPSGTANVIIHGCASSDAGSILLYGDNIKFGAATAPYAIRACIGSSSNWFACQVCAPGLYVGGALVTAGDAATITLKQTSTTATTGIYLERSGERKGYYMYISGADDSLAFQRNNAGTKSDVMILNRDGNVGIGTTSFLNTANFQISVGSGASSTPYMAVFNTATCPTSVASTRFDLGFLSGNSNYLVTGTVLGYLNFMGQANDAGYGGAGIYAEVVCGGNVGRITGHGVNLIFSTKAVDTAGYNERMRITSCGKVGIGATNPRWLLEICANNACAGAGHYPALSINNVCTLGYGAVYFYKGTDQMGGMEYSNSGCSLLLTTLHAGSLKLNTAGNDRLTISGTGVACFACQVCAPVAIISGCVGIGTTSPARQLELSTNPGINIITGTGYPGGSLRLSNLGEYESGYGTGGGNPDFLGTIEFYSGDTSTGTGVRTAIKSTVDAYYNLNALAFYTAPGNTAGILERMRIEPNGNVGIGTTSPYQNLQVYQTGAAGNNYVEGTIQVGGTSATLGAALSYASQNSGYVNLVNLNTSGGANARISLGFGAISSGLPASTVMTLNQSGYVGIGTCTPSTTLHVRTDDGVLIKGATSDIDAKLSFLPASGGRQYDFRNYGSSFGIKDASADTIRMYFHFNGNIGIGTTSPCALLHIAAPSANCVLWSAILNNPYNDGVAGYGVGLRLQNSTITGAQETHKWAGIAAIAGGSSGYSNETDLAFYVGCFISAANCTCPPVEKMRIKSSTGNVGIGTIDPIDKLHICGVDSGLYISNSTRSKINLHTCGCGGWQFETNNGGGNQPAGALGITEVGVGSKFHIAKGGVACFQNTVCAPLIVAPGTPLQVVYGKTVISSGGGLMSLGPVAAGTSPQYNCGCLITSVSFTPKRSNSIILIQTNNVSMWETQNMSDHFYLWSSNETDGTVLAKSGGYIQNLNCLSSGTHGAIVNLNEGACSWGTTAKTIAFRIGTTGNNGCFYQVNPSYAAAGFDSSTVGQFSYTIMEIAQ